MPNASKLNKKLVAKLHKNKRFQDPRIGRAFLKVPRHLFLPDVALKKAYSDQAIPTKYADKKPISSSSQPAMMAIMLEQLALEPGHHVLEIGAGTGYNAALMSTLVGDEGRVTAVDFDADIVAGAKTHLAAAEIEGVEVVQGDGMEGYAANAPYDRIILTVGAADIAPAWWDQLKEGGILVLPLAINGPQKSIAFRKMSDHFQSVSVESCGFMRLRGEMAAQDFTNVRLSPPHRPPDLELSCPPQTQIVEPTKAYAWLSEYHKTLSSGVNATLREAWSSLTFWIGLHEAEACTISGFGEWAEWEAMPVLYEYLAGDDHYVLSQGLLSKHGMAFLSRKRPRKPDKLAEMLVKAYGNDEALAQRLIVQIKAWDANGRPVSQQLQVRAFPRGRNFEPAPDETVLSKQYTTLLISWKL